MAVVSNYLQNKIVDWFLRGQAFTPPANVYVGLMTAVENPAAGGTEVTGGNYARVAVASSLANWAGTQAAASTVASSGTSGATSNNSAITFPAPSASWGSIVGMGVFDALTGGNLLWFAPMTAKTVNATDPAPSFAAAALSFTPMV